MIVLLAFHEMAILEREYMSVKHGDGKVRRILD
jgi:hypothetical protein